MPQTLPRGQHITSNSSSTNSREVALPQPKVAILDSLRAIAVFYLFLHALFYVGLVAYLCNCLRECPCQSSNWTTRLYGPVDTVL